MKSAENTAVTDKVLKEHEEGASFYSLESTVKRWNAAFIAHGESA